MNTSTKYDYSAPVVPLASPIDGLLRTCDLGDSVAVDIRLWSGIRPGYYLQLTLDGELVGDVWSMSDIYQPGDVVTLKLDSRLLAAEGEYALGFRSTNDKSEISNDSPTTPLMIDRSPPGAPLMAQMIFANASFGDFLKGRVPGYAGLAAGDMVQTVCNGNPGPVFRVRAENLTTTPIEISFTKELLEGLYSDKVNITYHVTDRAGNRSLLAQSVELTIQR